MATTTVKGRQFTDAEVYERFIGDMSPEQVMADGDWRAFVRQTYTADEIARMFPDDGDVAENEAASIAEAIIRYCEDATSEGAPEAEAADEEGE